MHRRSPTSLPYFYRPSNLPQVMRLCLLYFLISRGIYKATAHLAGLQCGSSKSPSSRFSQVFNAEFGCSTSFLSWDCGTESGICSVINKRSKCCLWLKLCLHNPKPCMCHVRSLLGEILPERTVPGQDVGEYQYSRSVLIVTPLIPLGLRESQS